MLSYVIDIYSPSDSLAPLWCVIAMCSEHVARTFTSSYPVIAALSTIACIYSVSTSPPLHAELYSSTVHPVNGTLQIVKCNTVPVVHCDRVVDQPERLHVHIYHMSMGIPFILACGVGTVFCILTRKEESIFSVNLLFIPDTYTPVNAREGSSVYTWELIFWSYVLLVHVVLVVSLTSPVDIFDTTVVVLFSFLCLMYLCRPRGDPSNDHALDNRTFNSGGMLQAAVLSTLLVCTWVTFTSIPHMYEQDRAWLFAVLLVLDGLLLLVHMYDSMPTMYTIVMGRLTFVILVNSVLAYSFATLQDRLDQYAAMPLSDLEG